MSYIPVLNVVVRSVEGVLVSCNVTESEDSGLSLALELFDFEGRVGLDSLVLLELESGVLE